MKKWKKLQAALNMVFSVLYYTIYRKLEAYLNVHFKIAFYIRVRYEYALLRNATASGIFTASFFFVKKTLNEYSW
jgi:hypothetical protein